MVKLTICLLCFFLPLYACADISIYKDEFTLIGLEKHSRGNVRLTSTLYGGSSDLGASSPADCVIKIGITKNKNEYSATLLPFRSGLMSYSSTQKDIAYFDLLENKINIFFEGAVDVCPLGTEFSGEFAVVNKHSKEFDALFDKLLEENYVNAVALFRSGKIEQAINSLEPYLTMSGVERFYNERIYNDYGYFLQQNKDYDESIKYFEVVKRKNPNRMAVYLNLADSFWEMKSTVKSMSNYRQYVKLMKMAGHNKQIPSRVLERIN
ncbi:tetratricopeptide repeat protein [Lonsdalea quercina]|uniref:tetratricopeptide repeat protein n=1 Tax=Lonsdalea quercina TaxID=71657 RepID=UPI00397584BE